MQENNKKIHNDISMIILAGGKSSRMGRDKSDLMLGDKTFLEHQIFKGRSLGISDILISGYRGERCAYPITQDRLVKDRYPEKGPLGGLEACLRRAVHETCLVLSVDVPLVPLQVLEGLIKAAEQSEAPAVIVSHKGHEESLIGVYRKDLAEEMVWEFTNRKGSVFAMLKRVGYEIYENDAEDIFFSDINDPGIYEMIQNEKR